MKSEVFIQPRARLDLLEQFTYLSEQGSLEVAERYIAVVHKTCNGLLIHPRQGAVYDSGIKRLQGMRRLPVSGFKKYLIFYIPQHDRVSIVRVLHGARDVEAILDEEEGLDG